MWTTVQWPRATKHCSSWNVVPYVPVRAQGQRRLNSCGEVVGTKPTHTVSWPLGFPQALSSTRLNREYPPKDDSNHSRENHLGTFYKHEMREIRISLHCTKLRFRQGAHQTGTLGRSIKCYLTSPGRSEYRHSEWREKFVSEGCFPTWEIELYAL